MGTGFVRRAVSAVAVDAALIAAIVGVAATAYAITRPPVFNRPNSIDPWLYTAAFVNYGYVHTFFGTTYYVSRLPWIIPGIVAHDVFAPAVAHVVLHLVFFVTGVAAAYAAAARTGERAAAVAAAGVLALSQMYYNANSTDYVDGAVITYVLLAAALITTRAAGGRRVATVALAGTAAAAALWTYLLAPIFMLGLLVPYLLVRPRGRRAFAGDLGFFAAGAAVTTIVCGIFSAAHGLGFWFFRPQIDFARNAQSSAYSLHGWEWITASSRVVAVALVGGACVIVLVWLLSATRLRDDRSRATAGLLGYAVVTVTLVAIWDVVFSGNILEYGYSIDMALPALALGIGAIVAAIAPSYQAAAGIVLVSAAPVIAIYAGDRAQLTARHVFWWIVAAAVAATALIVIAVLRGRRLFAIVASIGVAAAFAMAVDGDADVFQFGASTSASHQSYDLGLAVIHYLQQSGAQARRPYFWYAVGDDASFTDVQSLYYYSYTYLGLALPKIDADFRFRVDTYRPKEIVLLCSRRPCHHAQNALRRAGLLTRQAAVHEVAAGGDHVWIHVLDVTRLPPAWLR